MIDDPQALFVRVDSWFHPTALTTGPWRPDAMHGGPPSALLGWGIGRALEPGEHVARVNIDLERPVQLVPLTPVVTRRQVSRRVAHLEVQLRTSSEVMASARAVVLRGRPVPAAIVNGLDDAVPVAGPELRVVPPDPLHHAPVVFHRDAVEHRFLSGGFEVSGPSISWLRLIYPVVEGEPTTGLCHLLALADFGSAISQTIVPESGLGMINVDVSVALGRTPLGPWIGLDAMGAVNADGVGLAVTELRDRAGRVGVATQAQLAQPYGAG